MTSYSDTTVKQIAELLNVFGFKQLADDVATRLYTPEQGVRFILKSKFLSEAQRDIAQKAYAVL
jgi:hypothetical protein